jgi:hypothetical protein
VRRNLRSGGLDQPPPPATKPPVGRAVLATQSSAAYPHLVSRFWLTYCDLSGRVCGVLILDSWSLLQARYRACVEGLDCGTRYCEGHELEGDTATPCRPALSAVCSHTRKREAHS